MFRFIFLALHTVSHLHILSNAKVVQYSLEIAYLTAYPDGVRADHYLKVNPEEPGYSGPTLEADYGDILEVDVTNNIGPGEVTTVHWHGFQQRGTPFQDGPHMLTQCPITYGNTFRYRFPIQQWGTHWYHSHVFSQRVEGLWGPLIVNKRPEAYSYDDDIVITLSDWYHRGTKENEAKFLSPDNNRGHTPFPDSLLLNGRGRYPCHKTTKSCNPDEQVRYVYTISPERKYRMRVINVSSRTTFDFSVDGHPLQTIEIDGEDTVPVIADIAEIGPAQRYSFIIHTNQSISSRFLIRAEGKLSPAPPPTSGQSISSTFKEVTAVLEYDPSPHRNIQVEESTEPHNYTIIDPRKLPSGRRRLDESKLIPLDNPKAPKKVDHTIYLDSRRSKDSNGMTRFTFNGTRFKHPEKIPLMYQVIKGMSPLPNVPYLILKPNATVQMVIYNFDAPHPFHLHGHSFWIVCKKRMRLDYGGKPLTYDEKLDGIQLEAPRRDTVLVDKGYLVVIRFVADNPGVWLFHCHIDWHHVGGMALALLESPNILKKTMQIPEDHRRACEQS